ncbi:hypothetical protein [Clostridium paridis]|uniref:Uncharacterized protein n=1 Tax=Clostridium paridis TaxID=2803863 RepID=A0A937FEY7_9CLOT|nr:hypothetical protein [Clostridium paridis]MBL4932765.1 hypothetical protein [Clostridium paridis]
MDIEELRRRRRELSSSSETTLRNMEAIANESYRVAEVAHNSRKILDNLDKEFETQTGLKGTDIAFLFIATALQCGRIFIINNLTKIEKAGQGNRNEGFLHDLQDKILHKFDNGTVLGIDRYHAPLNQIITGRGVPYDATGYMDENFKLFKGANHRFATLGHDPILGLIFGTANILTNTITCVNAPIISTNHVIYDSSLKNPRIGGFAPTTVTLKKAVERLDGDVSSIVAAIIKQIIHIGTDMYTPCGIQFPGANLLLSKENTEKLTKYISTGDLVKIGASAGLSTLINTIISTVHMLMYDGTKYSSQDVYSVKTRKIILYSNLIASTSNIIWVGGNMIAGNEGAIKELDIGGLLVTLHRLMTDTKFIREVKEEFVFGGFNKMIQGDELSLKEVTLWE